MMMNFKNLVFALASLAGFVVASTPSFAVVEYVKICSIYGAYYYYSPGTDSCVNAITGEVKTQFEGGTINRQTYVTARVRALESDFCDECFAVVGSSGVSTRSVQMQVSTRLAVGRYNVTFNKRVDECAFSATLGSADSDSTQPPPGMITVARASATRQGVLIWTYNAHGDLTDRAFHLSLQCKQKTPYCTVHDTTGTHACTGQENVRDLGPPSPG